MHLAIMFNNQAPKQAGSGLSGTICEMTILQVAAEGFMIRQIAPCQSERSAASCALTAPRRPGLIPPTSPCVLVSSG